MNPLLFPGTDYHRQCFKLTMLCMFFRGIVSLEINDATDSPSGEELKKKKEVLLCCERAGLKLIRL